jgi:rRNA maturation endonuclease Nob1
MRLLRRKEKEDVPKLRCPQCGEPLPTENTIECRMCGADLRPLGQRPAPEPENAAR